jgi:hypothetical protein
MAKHHRDRYNRTLHFKPKGDLQLVAGNLEIRPEVPG